MSDTTSHVQSSLPPAAKEGQTAITTHPSSPLSNGGTAVASSGRTGVASLAGGGSHRPAGCPAHRAPLGGAGNDGAVPHDVLYADGHGGAARGLVAVLQSAALGRSLAGASGLRRGRRRRVLPFLQAGGGRCCRPPDFHGHPLWAAGSDHHLGSLAAPHRIGKLADPAGGITGPDRSGLGLLSSRANDWGRRQHVGDAGLCWSDTAEDEFLAEVAQRKVLTAPVAEARPLLQPGDWPGFRGPQRRRQADRRSHRDRLEYASSAAALCAHRIGPGWSSFVVVGPRLYTQEQRGPKEVISCYDAATGEEQWIHEDAARFTETVSGPGPRATPTYHENKLYALGATGTLNCLDPATGRPLWACASQYQDRLRGQGPDVGLFLVASGRP